MQRPLGKNILACVGQEVGVIPEMQILFIMMSPDRLLATQARHHNPLEEQSEAANIGRRQLQLTEYP